MSATLGCVGSRASWWPRTLAAGLAGALVALGYAPYNVWIAPVIGVALLALVIRAGAGGVPGPEDTARAWGPSPSRRELRRVAGLGFVFGLVMFSMTIAWEVVVASWLPLLLIPFMSLWTLAAAIGIHLVQRLPWWPVWAASVWLLMEFGSARIPFGGFGWDRLAFTTPDAPWGGYLGFIGAAGTSWLVALTGFLLAATWQVRRERRRLWPPVTIVLVIALLGIVLGRVPVQAPTGATVNVGMVQGNVDGSAGRHTMGYARSVTANHMSETVTLIARADTGLDPAPDFVLWPENSTDIDPTVDPGTAQLIDAAQAVSGLPILVGAVMQGPGPGERQTTGLWWMNGAVSDRYDKRNAVPFGEYTPMKDLVFALVPMAKEVGAQTVPGKKPGVLNGTLNDGRVVRVGDMICYELAFDSTVYDTVRNGAQILVVQSNNSTYTGTAQPRQQFQITRVRAMEMRREIVVSTTSSFSGLIDPQGRVLAKTQEATAAAQTFTVPLRTGVSMGIRMGPALEWALSAVGLAAMVVAAMQAIRRRQPVRD